MMQVTLQAIRVSLGYTAEEVAKYCGVTVEKINECEENSGEMTASMIIKLRKLYGIPIDYIKI